MKRMSEAVAQEAANHLAQHDPVLKPLVERHGLCTIRPHENYYQELVDSIISQQLSVHAARSIETRFRDLFGGHFPSPEEILTTDVETLRGLGFSRAKGAYVLDLAQHVVDGKVRFDHLDGLSNDEVIAELTPVKGIGTWTAHMFLMFCMGRTDVLPVGDLGIKNGLRRLYGFADVPTPDQITELAAKNHWHPYESVASWYVWQSLDNKPAL
ncbi:MAG TPA: DNA-3-methyladenine glycosylase [Candidatus Saccharimonadales bacterium]|nr:DNA-3-methyladenine glycosylase [Candidatus Saccharimonadales bacterium]